MAPSMRSLALSLLIASNASLAAAQVSSAVFKNILRFTQFSAAAYGNKCASPPFGSTVIQYFNTSDDTQATLFRSDAAKQVIIAFRGTSSPADLGTDLNFGQTALTATGTSCSSCSVHSGFAGAWASVQSDVISAVNSQLSSHSGYKLIVTGHSLGGGIAAIASSSFAALGKSPTVYTYGEPRNGNPAFTTYINSLIPTTSYFRVTHFNDGVPQIPPTLLGYQHHGTEYWESAEVTNTASTTQVCPGIEPSNCNAQTSFGTDPINQAHLTYQNVGGLIGNALHIAACGATST